MRAIVSQLSLVYRASCVVFAILAATALTSCASEAAETEAASVSESLQEDDTSTTSSEDDTTTTEFEAKLETWCSAIATFIEVKQPGQSDDLVRSAPFLLQTIANKAPADAPEEVTTFFTAYADAKGADIKSVDTGEDQTETLESAETAITEAEEVAIGFVEQSCPDIEVESLNA